MTPHALLDALEARLVTAPPPGVSSVYAAGFFARRRGQLLLHLRAALPVMYYGRVVEVPVRAYLSLHASLSGAAFSSQPVTSK